MSTPNVRIACPKCGCPQLLRSVVPGSWFGVHRLLCMACSWYEDEKVDGVAGGLIKEAAAAVAKANRELVAVDRLRRKLAQRDRRIAGMERRILELEAEVARRSNTDLKREMTRAVQDALANVRMIPVLGVGHPAQKIVEVTVKDAPPRNQSPAG